MESNQMLSSNMDASELNECGDNPPKMDVQIFKPITPMLSKRLDVTNVGQLRENTTYQVEDKFDGERFQVHMENGVFDYYSRRGHSCVKTFGSNYGEGVLTPLLKDCFSPNVHSFILDGEMMGWDKQKQCFGSRGMKFDIKKIKENAKFRPCFCVFDLLYYNGKALAGPQKSGGVTLGERLQLLDDMFTDIPGVIQHSKRVIVEKRSDILGALNKAIENQEEGIVVKDTESYYVPNRRNAGWYKIKPEYTEGTMTDLDLVIIGADEAKTTGHGSVRSFLVACADQVVPGCMPQRWVCMGRVSFQLNYKDQERVCAALEPHWTRTQDAPPPPSLVFNKIRPDFWIMPEKSIVLEIRATELVQNNNYGTNYTLRFSRVVRVRDDKPVQDILTLDEFNGLAANKGPVVKLSTNKVSEDRICEVKAKPSRKNPTVATQSTNETQEDKEVPTASGLQKTNEDVEFQEFFANVDDDGPPQSTK